MTEYHLPIDSENRASSCVEFGRFLDLKSNIPSTEVVCGLALALFHKTEKFLCTTILLNFNSSLSTELLMIKAHLLLTCVAVH